MIRRPRNQTLLPLALLASTFALAQSPAPLPRTLPLEIPGDLSARMVAGIDRYALRALDQSVAARAPRWNRDPASPAAYARSVEPNREHLRRIIGAVDPRASEVTVEFVASTEAPSLLAETQSYSVHAVRWPVVAGVHAEGLLLQPKARPRARLVLVPDASQTPEALAGLASGPTSTPALAARLAENGCQILIPTTLDRTDAQAGNARLNRFTNLTHREWIYRQAFEMGRHVIGYEVQQVLAAVDWFERESTRGPRIPVGAAGYSEGGLVALHAAALDPRIQAALVSGYFDSRQRVWTEPIDRNVFGLLREFGDAELASLVAPRSLVIEYSAPPAFTAPTSARPGRIAASAPGVIATPSLDSVQREFARAQQLVGAAGRGQFHLIQGADGQPVPIGSPAALNAFWHALFPRSGPLPPASLEAPVVRGRVDPAARQARIVRAWETHTQSLLERSESVREETFWKSRRPARGQDWTQATRDARTKLWDEVIGRLPAADRPANPRTRVVAESAAWTAYDVVLDVWDDVFAWGVLLLPKDLRPGERRPVVVCQHGLEGLPVDTFIDDPKARAFGYYKAFAARLAERGFIVFSPHNPYRGRDDFRGLQRKLNPLGLTLFSVILAQHERILDWLGSLPSVDPSRIGFYGLSYGGKAAMRVPALLDRYALSICSGDFNEWIRKNASVDLRYGYLYTGEYEIFEYNLGHTFNYAEMAALIAPRPFMVERGHDDGVGVDEWVSYEYAKVRRLYTKLGIPQRTTIEYFDGPHTIHGVGTFDFLHEHLRWPKR